jgi:hypothetical protein
VVWRKNTSPTSSSRGVKIDTEEGLAAARNGQVTGRPRTKLLNAPTHMNAKTWRQRKNSMGAGYQSGKKSREETSLHTNETKEKLRSKVNTTHDAKTSFPLKSNESLTTTEVTALPPSFDWN